VPPKGYANLSIRKEVKDALEELRKELGVNDFSDLIAVLVKMYREFSETKKLLENIVVKLDILIATKPSTQHQNTSPSTASTSPSQGAATKCVEKSKIRDIKAYVTKLKEKGILIDWWEDLEEYCFELKSLPEEKP